MFDLGQKVLLESFQLCLMVFWIELPFYIKKGLSSETEIVIQSVESRSKILRQP